MLSSVQILVLNGPNLGRLGKREPQIYGKESLDDILVALSTKGLALNVGVTGRQSNHEGDLIDWIGAAEDEGFSGILFNPGAFTHTSYALYDAIKGSALPVVEVHISNPDAREAFRRESKIAPACMGRVAGFGAASYTLALEALVGHLAAQKLAEAPAI